MLKSSYVWTPSKSGQVLFTTIPRLLEFRANANPDKAAHIFRTLKTKESTETNRVVVTFKELADRSLSVASSFLALGIKPHDKVAMIGSNCPEFLYVDYACVRISVLMIRLPPTILDPDIILNALEKHKIKALILDDPEIASRLEGMLPGIMDQATRCTKYNLSDIDHVIFLKKSHLEHQTEALYVENLIQAKPSHNVEEIQKSQDPDDPVLVYPTSGSTGHPRFVLHSHHALASLYGSGETGESPFGNDSYLSDRPFSWIGGFSMCAALAGITAVNLDPAISTTNHWAKTFMSTINEENVTSALFMPKGMYDLFQLAKGDFNFNPPQIRISTGGELVPWELVQFAMNQFPTFSLRYGSTEMPYIGISEASLQEEKNQSIYWMETHRFIEVKIVDDEERVLPTNMSGHIRVRSPAMMKGYLDDPEATEDAFDTHGWLKTGDLGKINDKGQLRIIGRSKDVISKGGNKIYPIAIENVLIKCDSVQEVSVVDVPDPRLFNEICACIIPKPGAVVTEEDLREFCKQQTLADATFLEPKYFLFLKEFPVTSTDKVSKKELRKIATKMLKLEI